ncbi:S1 family peptidase [Candidatus Contubernalis alkaliaceticus]|uniref:S1 family peptidase n=1 Tax=Candidatus Contubernalis alkaliaceticus TaxID=338645 RepID=UPI001F4BF214|nr:serine protease [Candidatus Contubernalis alkalaceticus]UNC92234.1 trypsin-like peptidase domain-containing protein [Candidatus Contubernalis alkalaceticus]
MNKELDDAELKQELNEMYGDEEINQDMQRKKPCWVIRIIAFLVVILFLGYTLNRWFVIWQWPKDIIEQHHTVLAHDAEIKELQKSVVTLKAYTSDGELKGTGFNIEEDGLVVTNRHLVEGAYLITVSFLEEGIFKVVNWSYSEEYDLAVLELEAEGLPFVNMQEEFIPGIDDELLIIGNPLSHRRIASLGEMKGYRESQQGSRTLLISASIFPGSSGSPVFDKDKKVVGVIFAFLKQNVEENNSMGLAVPSSEILYFISTM